MKKKKYTKEFKQQALDLAASLGSATEAARQLGISDGSIYTWRMRQVVDGSAPVRSGESEAEELKRLRGENAQSDTPRKAGGLMGWTASKAVNFCSV